MLAIALKVMLLGMSPRAIRTYPRVRAFLFL
jgi:hypothetical protein